MSRRTLALLALGFAPASAWAQAVSSAEALLRGPERPLLPAWSLAGDDGAASIWRNPANLGLDPDPSWMFMYAQPVAEGEQVPGVSFIGNAGPLATGVAYTGGPNTPAWWTLSTGLAVRSGSNYATGIHLGWQIPEGSGNNFVTWDAGATWRPTHWLGVGGVAQNIGSPAKELGVFGRYGPGVVLRPFGDTVHLGTDYLLTADALDQPGILEADLRIRPHEGLSIRVSGNQEGTVSAGLEVYMGRAGVGAHARLPTSVDADPIAFLYARSSDTDRRLVQDGDKVPHFELADAYEYQPVGGFFSAPGESYLHLLERMRAAAEDPAVQGVLVELDHTPFSMAQIQELRAVMDAARKRGKPVIAYLDSASSNSAYLLACGADRIFMHPAGDLGLVGLSLETQYLRGTLDLVGVEPQFAKRAEYKSAPESFTNTEGSPTAREQLNALADDLTSVLVEGIAAGRRKNSDDVRALIDRGPFTASEAVDEGLVDGLLYPDELEDELEDVFTDGYHLASGYRMVDDTRGWPDRHEIAVIYIEGGIHSGESGTPGFFGGGYSAGSETVVRQLDQARRDGHVRAVVLRVDSPGGSAFASDEIWRAVERLKDDEKPVIVSMGGVAASGGYYVAAGADAIYASPATITGSIGVYGGHFSLEGLFEKVGINTELYTRGRHSGMWSASKPMDASEFAAMDRLVGATYTQFKERVADGRGLEAEVVEAAARGRVWSGERALNEKLVDELGGFHAALDRARTEAHIPERAPVVLVAYSRWGTEDSVPRRAIQAVAQTLRPNAQPPTLPVLPPELAALEQWRLWADDPILAVMPYHLEVE